MWIRGIEGRGEMHAQRNTPASKQNASCLRKENEPSVEFHPFNKPSLELHLFTPGQGT